MRWVLRYPCVTSPATGEAQPLLVLWVRQRVGFTNNFMPTPTPVCTNGHGAGVVVGGACPQDLLRNTNNGKGTE
jgi:hypothetical protein